MISRTIDNLQPHPRNLPEVDQLDAGEMAPKRLAAALPALSRISTPRTSRASRSWTTKLLLLAGVVGSPEVEGALLEALLPTLREATLVVAEVVLLI